MGYKVIYSASAAKTVERLDKPTQRRIIKFVDSLETQENPRSTGKALQGYKVEKKTGVIALETTAWYAKFKMKRSSFGWLRSGIAARFTAKLRSVPASTPSFFDSPGIGSAGNEHIDVQQSAAAVAPKVPAGWSLVTVPAAGLNAATADAVIRVGQGKSQFTWIKATDGAMPALAAGEAVFVFAKKAGNL